MKNTHTSQDGVALPVAAGMLTLISILVVVFFTVAIRTNTTSVADRSTKRALAAAEAGLQTAVYRLNALGASAQANAANCLTTTWVAPTDGECPGRNEAMGNGAQYTYYVTPATTAGSAGCIALPAAATAQDRCVTSVGTAGGVSRRIQTRVLQQPGIPDFNNVGLVGKSLVHAWNSINLSTDVASNLMVRFENSINVNDDDSINVDGKVLLYTGGQYIQGNSVNVEGGQQTVTTPFDLPMPDFAAVESLDVNDNETLVTDLGTSWNATTRQINLGNSVTKTIRPGTYHVCGVFLGNSVKLRFSHSGGSPTKIYVDSPSRPGSICAGQADPAGTFAADNSVEINKEVGEREELLKIYMYGTPYNDTRDTFASWCTDGFTGGQTGECRSDFMLDNSVSFYGSVYAPNSSVQAHNSVTWQGSVAADKIRFYNSINFQVTGPTIAQGGEGSGAAERRGWAECRPERTVTTDPESGC
jgi:Tfp pilus assembly protein PilX